MTMVNSGLKGLSLRKNLEKTLLHLFYKIFNILYDQMEVYHN